MSTMIKYSVDETQWYYILDCICDALGSFSEADQNHEIRILLDKCANQLSDLISKENEC